MSQTQPRTQPRPHAQSSHTHRMTLDPASIAIQATLESAHSGPGSIVSLGSVSPIDGLRCYCEFLLSEDLVAAAEALLEVYQRIQAGLGLTARTGSPLAASASSTGDSLQGRR